MVTQKKMEKVQERALRIVYEDFSSSYEDLLQKTGLPSLHIRRMRIMAIEFFKILNEMCPPVLSNLVQKRSSSYNFRYTNILQVPTVKTTLLVRGHSNTRHLCYGTHFQMILDNVPILISLRG